MKFTTVLIALTLTITALADGSNATQKLDNLTILDCTHILNQYTPFQVSLEIPLKHLLPKNHHLDLAQINQNTQSSTIEAIVNQDPDYYVIITNNCAHILYRKADLMLSQNLSDFNVHGDLVDVFLALRQEIPSLVLLYPFIIGGRHLTGPNPYVPPTPYQHQTYGGQTVSLQLTNASGRDVLSQATQAQTNHMYWIAEYAGTNVIASFFSKNDIDHDPELLERIRQAQEESEKGLGQNQGPQPK